MRSENCCQHYWTNDAQVRAESTGGVNGGGQPEMHHSAQSRVGCRMP